MHPLVARIHPAVRTAFFAWIASRSLLWIGLRDRSRELADGAFLPGLADLVTDAGPVLGLSDQFGSILSYIPWIGVEVAILGAGVAVYRFVRRTDLPRVAERACWLWMFNPVWALTAQHWGVQLAAATGAIAVAGFAGGRHRRAVAAGVIALGCRLEFILLWPAVAAAIWAGRSRGDQSTFAAAVSITAIPAAFAAWIVATWHLAGTAGISLRALHGEASWRTTADLVPGSTLEVLLVIGIATCAGLALRYLRRFPRWYFLLAICALGWPLLQVPIQYGAVALIWSLPTFAHLGVVTDDGSVERPLLAGFAGAFVATCLLF